MRSPKAFANACISVFDISDSSKGKAKCHLPGNPKFRFPKNCLTSRACVVFGRPCAKNRIRIFCFLLCRLLKTARFIHMGTLDALKSSIFQRPRKQKMTTSNEIPKDPELRWEWIKFQLRARETSLSKLAKALGVERNAMNNVKRGPYPRMERAIALALKLEPEDIWPERWGSNGQPSRPRNPKP
ncbi:hypothetical protein CLJ08_03625 [Pseudomonas mosselii]|nr:hypothetical protein CLJ08_03625 [Pseudomonas mosselii]